MQTATVRRPEDRVNPVTSIPFAVVHLLPLLAIWTGVSVRALVLCVVLYAVRMTFITVGYHRYFAHRSFTTNRVVQFLLAFGGTMAAQKGPLWWAAHHRDHHRFADTDRDPHSPIRGFWWSHVGWILCDKHNETKYDRIGDFAKYPEIRFIDKQNWIGPWSLGVATFLLFGAQGLVVGFFWSTILLWHATFMVNSTAHVFGRRRYATGDTSRNSWIVALLTGGEGWHNNHHYFPRSVRQGFYWWEYDTGWWLLRTLSWAGLVRDMKMPSKQVRASGRVRDGNLDIGMFRSYWNKASEAVNGIGTARQSLEAKLESTLTTAEEVARATRRRASPTLLSE